jgi:hypothetical protein
MLTTQSYLIAMLVYGSAVLIGLPLLRRLWFAKPLTKAGGATLGFLTGMLLVPASPGPDIASMAPALIVVLFNTLFGDGFESSLAAAIWLLGAALAGMVIGLLLAGRRTKRAGP